MRDRIYVTRPSLPSLEEFIPYLDSIWHSRNLTNGGRFHAEFERKLADYLGVDYLSVFVNGTVALMAALRVLRISGEVITTPYSFVATSHSLLWNDVVPVFVDIDKRSFNIDPKKIETAITDKTSAIMPVHCYGNPCAVEKIQEIADRHGLKVIYDAAHAFGVNYKGESLLNFGDLSILSFHATKVFNTFEGGAIICKNERLKKDIDFIKNFGFADEVTVVSSGMNGKMNEFQAALGVLQLKHIDGYMSMRQKVDRAYRDGLAGVKGVSIPDFDVLATRNFSYFPVLIGDDYPLGRDDLYRKLRSNNVYVRRYFYPLISDFSMYKSLPSACPDNLRTAHDVADRIICLPIYPDLPMEDVEFIVSVIKEG